MKKVMRDALASRGINYRRFLEVDHYQSQHMTREELGAEIVRRAGILVAIDPTWHDNAIQLLNFYAAAFVIRFPSKDGTK